MNILILANHFNPGGISSYILNLGQGLAARAHKVYVASGGGAWLPRLKRYNLEHIYLPLRTKSIMSPKLFFACAVLGRILKEKKIDIMHSQTRISSVLALWVSRKTSIPFVYTAHGFLNPRWARRTFPCWGKLVIAISQPVKEHLLRNFGLGEDRIRLVHNGIERRSDCGDNCPFIRSERAQVSAYGNEEGHCGNSRCPAFNSRGRFSKEGSTGFSS